MNALVLRLVNGLAAVQDSDVVVEPETEMGEGEELLGEITDLNLKKLFVLHGRETAEFRKKLLASKAELGHDHTPECPACARSADLLVEHDYGKGVENLFWAAVKTSLTPENRLKTIMAGGVGLRKGWKIVTLAPEPEPEMEIVMLGPIDLGGLDLAQFGLDGLGGKPKTKGKPKKE